MTKSLFDKENLLSYVDNTYDRAISPEQKNPLLVAVPKSNGLALTAMILTGAAFLGAILIVPPVISAGFSIAALVIAIKRGTSKILSLIALGLSVLFFISGVIVAGFFISAYEAKEEVRYPANYSLDYLSGIAYKYTPEAQIPCDAAGICILTVDLLATETFCAAGGEAEQSVFSNTTGMGLEPVIVAVPPLDVRETATITFSFTSTPNDTLMLITSPDFFCA